MAKTSFIINQWENQEKVFLNNLSLLRKRITGKAVHDLRVAIKKLRSYNKLVLSILEKEELKNDWPDMEELFSVLGKYRDLQMNQHLLNKKEKEDKEKYISIKRFLQAASPGARQRIVKAVKKFPLEELTTVSNQFKTELSSFSQTGLIEKIKKHLEKVIQELAELVKDIKKGAHPIRKKLKNIFYWLSACPDRSVITLSKLKALDKIQDHLGDWQDQQVLLGKLRHHRKEFIPGKTEEYRMYKELEKKIKEKNNLALDDIQKKIEKWVKGLHWEVNGPQ